MFTLKRMAVAAALTIFSFAMASVSYAYEDCASGCTWGSSSSLKVTSSKSVSMEYATSGTGISYVIGAFHLTGSKTFGASSGDQKLYSKDNAAVGTGETLPGAPADTGPADFSGSGFTAL